MEKRNNGMESQTNRSVLQVFLQRSSLCNDGVMAILLGLERHDGLQKLKLGQCSRPPLSNLNAQRLHIVALLEDESHRIHVPVSDALHELPGS